MDKLKCPRCKNEELQGNENYCPICGLDLEEKTAQEVPVQEQLIIDIGFTCQNLEELKKILLFDLQKSNID